MSIIPVFFDMSGATGDNPTEISVLFTEFREISLVFRRLIPARKADGDKDLLVVAMNLLAALMGFLRFQA